MLYMMSVLFAVLDLFTTEISAITFEELIFKVHSKCQSEVIRILNQLETELGVEKIFENIQNNHVR